MSSLLQQLMHLPAPLVLSVVGALVFGEAAVFLGFVLPGETAVLLAGFLASTGRFSVVLLALVVVVAGKRFGPRLMRTRLFLRHEPRLVRARGFLDGRGAPAIFVGRFTAFLRAVTPGLAGLSGMRYRRFLLWNALGGLVWGVGCVVAGYVAGSSYQQMASRLGQGGAAAAAVIVVLALVAWRVGRRRHRAADQSAAPPDTGLPAGQTVAHGTCTAG